MEWPKYSVFDTLSRAFVTEEDEETFLYDDREDAEALLRDVRHRVAGDGDHFQVVKVEGV